MSYSAISFDTAHNVAHVLKDAGYFVNIIALALSSLIEREETIRVQYERLKQSDKMKDEFINVAAHELRTPIQPILSLTEVLRSKISDTEQQELLDVILRNAKRSQRLTNDIYQWLEKCNELKALNFDPETKVNDSLYRAASTGYLPISFDNTSKEPRTLKSDNRELYNIIND
jgi:signal transduction histidine kinase